ncbi:MAG: ABC transporter permease, partial [Pseudomonadota bacterium]
MKYILPIANRIFYAVVLLMAVLVLNFSMMYLAPGDIADTIAQASGGATEEMMDQIRADYGLDQPFIVQLFSYVAKVATFDLGYSFFYNQPVTTLIFEKLPATLLLVITAQLLALVVGVLLGVFSARNPKGLASYVVTFVALFGYAAPVFWTGILLLIAFSLKVPIFPVAGMMDVTAEGWFAQTLSVARHMTLPTITLASIFLALYSRLCR